MKRSCKAWEGVLAPSSKQSLSRCIHSIHNECLFILLSKFGKYLKNYRNNLASECVASLSQQYYEKAPPCHRETSQGILITFEILMEASTEKRSTPHSFIILQTVSSKLCDDCSKKRQNLKPFYWNVNDTDECGNCCIFHALVKKINDHVQNRKKMVRNDLNWLARSRLQTRLWLKSCRSPSREIPHFSHCQTHSRGEPEEYKNTHKNQTSSLQTLAKHSIKEGSAHLCKHSGKHFQKKKQEKKKKKRIESSTEPQGSTLKEFEWPTD